MVSHHFCDAYHVDGDDDGDDDDDWVVRSV
jgi:hypothetical protein